MTANCRHRAGHALVRCFRAGDRGGWEKGARWTVAKPGQSGSRLISSFFHFKRAPVWVLLGVVVVRALASCSSLKILPSRPHGCVVLLVTAFPVCGWCFAGRHLDQHPTHAPPPLPPVLTYYLVRRIVGVLAAREWTAVWRTNLPQLPGHQTGVIVCVRLPFLSVLL